MPTILPTPEPGEIDAAKAAELRTSRANVIVELEDLLGLGPLPESARARVEAILEDHEGTVVKLAASAIIEWAHG